MSASKLASYLPNTLELLKLKPLLTIKDEKGNQAISEYDRQFLESQIIVAEELMSVGTDYQPSKARHAWLVDIADRYEAYLEMEDC